MARMLGAQDGDQRERSWALRWKPTSALTLAGLPLVATIGALGMLGAFCLFVDAAVGRRNGVGLGPQGPPLRELERNRRLFEWVGFGADVACRLSSQDHSDDGNATVYARSAPTLKACQDLCDAQDLQGCKGIEYGVANKRCELWTRPIGVVSKRKGFRCLARMPADEFLMNGDAACRADKADATEDGRGTAEIIMNVDHLACRYLCRTLLGSACTGVEYYNWRAGDAGRCEIWQHAVGDTVAAKGFACSIFQPHDPVPPIGNITLKKDSLAAWAALGKPDVDHLNASRQSKNAMVGAPIAVSDKRHHGSKNTSTSQTDHKPHADAGGSARLLETS